MSIANTRVYADLSGGFIGTGLKKEEFLFECSDLDDIIVFTKRGIMKVIKVADKTFIGKDIIHAAVFLKMTIEQHITCSIRMVKPVRLMPNGLMLQASPVKKNIY